MSAARRLGAVALLLLGCGGALPPVTEDDARRAGLSLGELRAGRQRYVDKCSGCHPPHPPASWPAAEWPAHLDDMRDEVTLEPADRALILSYLGAFAQDGPARPEPAR